MKLFRSTGELLDFAIGEEEAASLFYKELSESVDNPSMRELFLQFSSEERKHREKLEKIKEGKMSQLPDREVLSLGLSDILVDETPTPGMSYGDALVLAMKKEEAAYRLYTGLAEAATESGVRDVLLGLAREEANHRLRFETEYDEHVLTEN